MITVNAQLFPRMLIGSRKRSPLASRGQIQAAFLALLVLIAASSQADDNTASDEQAEPKYPLAVAVDGDTLYVVDLDLPGVWAVQGEQRELFVRGTKLLRTPLNRPRCVAIHPAGGILVGDSATREVYHVASSGAEPKPLSNGGIGIAMAIAVSPDG